MTNNASVKRLYNAAEAGWMTRERMLVLALLVATGLSFYVCYQLARPFLPALAWALALGVVAHPLHEWIERHIHNANLAAAMAVLLVSVMIIAPSVWAAGHLVREGAASLERIREGTATGRWQAVLERVPRVATAVNWLQSHVNLRAEAEHAVTAFKKWFSSVVASSIWSVAELLITLFFLFYFFRDRRAILRTLRSLVPLTNTETDQIFARVSDTVYANIYGTVMGSLVQGALGALMFWWLGLPSPLLWGFVMALLSIIPALGSFVVWVPAAVLLALEGSWGKAASLTVWGLGVIGTIDNLLYPIFVGKRMQLHTLPVFVALLGGLTMFGASGLILGPVALAVTAALLDIWRRRTADGQAAEVGVEPGRDKDGDPWI
jgi:predicted PurR-regulated permease PerM